MSGPMEGQAFLFMWIGFLLLMTGGIAAFFLWAVRAGQFSQQDRARYLALNSGIPDGVTDGVTDAERRRERGRQGS